MLKDHPEKRFAQYLLEGIEKGFCIGFDYAQHSVTPCRNNMLSTLDHPQVVTDYLKQELELERGARIAKMDIKSAYCLVPVHPQDRFLLGMRWNKRIFVDNMLPFGLRSAPKIFTAVADSLEWVQMSREWHKYTNILTILTPRARNLCMQPYDHQANM